MLKYFRPYEFQRGETSWFQFMSLDLLQKLDDTRHNWGMRIRVSPALGAVGRQDGSGVHSMHNFDRWGEVRAVDLMPDGIDSPEAAIAFISCAKAAGMRGIGFYPHWIRNNKPAPGFHLDNREKLSEWGAINKNGQQIYVTLEEAIARFHE